MNIDQVRRKQVLAVINFLKIPFKNEEIFTMMRATVMGSGGFSKEDCLDVVANVCEKFYTEVVLKKNKTYFYLNGNDRFIRFMKMLKNEANNIARTGDKYYTTKMDNIDLLQTIMQKKGGDNIDYGKILDNLQQKAKPPLTVIEKKMLKLLRKGYEGFEIVKELGVSETNYRTIKSRVFNKMRKKN